MKKISTFIIALFVFTAAMAQLENTRWKTKLDINGPLNCIIDFKKDILSIYTVADSTMIETMTWQQDDSSFTVVKTSGQSDCDNSMPGKYRYRIDGENLLVELLKDDCYDRYNTIENTHWKKWKDYPGIKVDEAILKQYTGVYALDEARPITISVEQGILYAEGANSGLPKSPFTAITPTKFLLRVAGVEMDFVKDAAGRVIKMISHEEKDYELKKIK
jgi:hypothetical protein